MRVYLESSIGALEGGVLSDPFGGGDLACPLAGGLWPTAGDFFCRRPGGGGTGFLPFTGDADSAGALSGVAGLRPAGADLGVEGPLACGEDLCWALTPGTSGTFLVGGMAPPGPWDMLGDFLCTIGLLGASPASSDGIFLCETMACLLFSCGDLGGVDTVLCGGGGGGGALRPGVDGGGDGGGDFFTTFSSPCSGFSSFWSALLSAFVLCSSSCFI